MHARHTTLYWQVHDIKIMRGAEGEKYGNLVISKNHTRRQAKLYHNLHNP
jgi:hypothetical protein